MDTWYKRVAKAIWGLLAGVGVLASAFFLWKSRTRGPSTFSESRKVQQLRRDIAKNNAERDQLVKSVEDRKPEIAELSKKIADHKRVILEIEKRAQGEMSDAEIEAAYDSLGY